MRFANFVVMAAVVGDVGAFQPISLSRIGDSRTAFGSLRRLQLQAESGGPSFEKMQEFEYLLQETPNSKVSSASLRRIELQGQDSNEVLMASSFAGAPTPQESRLMGGESTAAPTEGDLSDDPYADLESTQSTMYQSEQVQPVSQQNKGIEQRLKNMEFQEIVSFIFVPSILAFVGLRWVANKVKGKVDASFEENLELFARELIYHDGDTEEMRLCVNAYKRNPSLMTLGPKQTAVMVKAYLAQYVKKRNVSPQSISSLSIAFSLFNLSEKKTADLLVSVAEDLAQTKSISSAGKLLFYGERILKDKDARARLKDIHQYIAQLYNGFPAEEALEMSQSAIKEAAYKVVVSNAGKDQTKMPAGWQILGLTKDEAKQIFEELKEDGFDMDAKEKNAGKEKEKEETILFDKRGRHIDAEGNLMSEKDIAEAIEDGESTNVYENPDYDDEDEEEKGDKEENEEEDEKLPTSNVYECGKCGYTLFIAKGREEKFYGAGFKCPECGAAKDEFKAVGDLGEV